MIFENMRILSLNAPWRVVKVNDTISDLQESINAGTWSVGIAVGSYLMVLKKTDYNILSYDEKERVIDQIREKFIDNNADFVINTMKELPDLLLHIDELIGLGKRPSTF